VAVSSGAEQGGIRVKMKLWQTTGLVAALGAATLTCAPTVHAEAARANGVGTQFELAFWQSVDGSAEPAMYEAYLAKYPDGTFSPLAKAKIATLRKAVRGTEATAATLPADLAPMTPATPRLAPVPQIIPATGPTIAPPMEQPRFASAEAAPATPQSISTPVQSTSTPVVSASNAAVTPVVLADAGNQPSTLGAMLAALARSQSAQGAEPAVTVAANSVQSAGYVAPATASLLAALQPAASPAVPARPQLLPVPSMTLPASFCSPADRNAFHDASYAPAVDAARRNNDAAVGYMKQIQASYDARQLSGDSTTMNALAAEARAWQPVAAEAYAAQAGLVRQFDALMAVPLSGCAGGQH